MKTLDPFGKSRSIFLLIIAAVTCGATERQNAWTASRQVKCLVPRHVSAGMIFRHSIVLANEMVNDADVNAPEPRDDITQTALHEVPVRLPGWDFHSGVRYLRIMLSVAEDEHICKLNYGYYPAIDLEFPLQQSTEWMQRNIKYLVQVKEQHFVGSVCEIVVTERVPWEQMHSILTSAIKAGVSCVVINDILWVRLPNPYSDKEQRAQWKLAEQRRKAETFGITDMARGAQKKVDFATLKVSQSTHGGLSSEILLYDYNHSVSPTYTTEGEEALLAFLRNNELQTQTVTWELNFDDNVEARVGLDILGDGLIEKWIVGRHLFVKAMNPFQLKTLHAPEFELIPPGEEVVP